MEKKETTKSPPRFSLTRLIAAPFRPLAGTIDGRRSETNELAAYSDYWQFRHVRGAQPAPSKK
jgi:hypothetical protein